MKAPKNVLSTMTKIQCRSLWGGSEEKHKIAWVRWEVVCSPKTKGGLGVRNLENFNKSLIGKWRWRLLNEKDAIWMKVLEESYGGDFNPWQPPIGAGVRSEDSVWWKDLSNCGTMGHGTDWFKNGLQKS